MLTMSTRPHKPALLQERSVICYNGRIVSIPDHRRPAMSDHPLFKWRHFQADIILCGVRWYLRYALSYRDVEELMQERGVMVDHTTIFRWVQRYAPELDQRCRPQLEAANDSYRADETYIRINKQWHYL
jgi:transposase, IS6 family